MIVQPQSAMLEVSAAPAPAMVQDGGRPGHMHQGVPPGGALVPELFAAANHAVGNFWNAPALEIYGDLALLVQRGPAWAAIDEYVWFSSAGEQIVVPRSERTCVRYLAIRGGFDIPKIQGGRGTLVAAAIGGLDGRLLRRGDQLMAGMLRVSTRQPAKPVALDFDDLIRVVRGPDQKRFSDAAYAVLLENTFTVSPASDRVGMRLIGERVARLDDDASISTPMVRGAIQVPASGELIVLGPDHPTTGGYPVIAAVISADLGRLAARRAGATVRFHEVTLAAATVAWQRYHNDLLGSAIAHRLARTD